jgi:hypothetical protein
MKEPNFDLQELYRQEAEESQRLIGELTHDLRLFACPSEVLRKIDRLAVIWGIVHNEQKGHA